MEISPELIQAAFALLTVLFSWASYELAQYIRKKGGNEQMSNVVWQVQEIGSAAIAEAEAVVVREAKANNKWDAAKQKRVKDEVVEKVMANLTVSATKFIIKNFGNLEEYVRGRIEADITEARK
jgi:hypothetical protein